jgi:hypothetical protein
VISNQFQSIPMTFEKIIMADQAESRVLPDGQRGEKPSPGRGRGGGGGDRVIRLNPAKSGHGIFKNNVSDCGRQSSGRAETARTSLDTVTYNLHFLGIVILIT